MIISASRRTDIPAYYSDWMIERLRDGHVDVRNPMNYHQISHVDLSPDSVDCIVFWSKDPNNIMDKLDTIDRMGHDYYFQFTLTPYRNDIEPNLRDKDDIIRTFKELSERVGKERVVWRYDPIILNDDFTESWHIEKFKQFYNELSDHTEECFISFVDMYPKLRKLERNGIIRTIDENEKLRMIDSFGDVANDIKLSVCCELPGHNGSCIDRERIKRITSRDLVSKGKTYQRPLCNCSKSIDIGTYGSCKAGCVYCYAKK